MYFRLLSLFTVLLLAACQSTAPVAIEPPPKPAVVITPFTDEDDLPPHVVRELPEWLVHESDWHCFPLDEYSLLESRKKYHLPVSPNDDIWPRLQAGLILPYIDNPEVNSQLRWYVNNPAYMERVQQRANRYLHFILENLHENDAPYDLALLPIVESAYEPFAYSHGQASGLWQFIPMTGKRFQLKQDWWYDGRRDTVESTRAAISYLRYLHRFFNEDWLLALAAYNAGEGTVRRAIQKNEQLNKPTDFWHLDLRAETRAYVPKMIALAELFRNPQRYELPLISIPNKPYFVDIPLDSQLDLMQAAELANISIEELYYLNPGFNRWATPPGKGYSLKIPVHAELTFTTALAQLPANQRVTWQRHTIAKGESLNSIARKYHSDIDWIKQINKLQSNTIVVGQTLMIPVASANMQHYRYSQTERLNQQQNRAPANNRSRIDYTVKAGDTFWSIAKKHQVEIQALARWNNKAPKDALRIGEKLVIWVPSSKAKNPYPERQEKVSRINYRVRSGDSLAKIAAKFKVGVNQIVQWNKLDGKKYLQPGQQLILYVNVMNTSH